MTEVPLNKLSNYSAICIFLESHYESLYIYSLIKLISSPVNKLIVVVLGNPDLYELLKQCPLMNESNVFIRCGTNRYKINSIRALIKEFIASKIELHKAKVLLSAFNVQAVLAMSSIANVRTQAIYKSIHSTSIHKFRISTESNNFAPSRPNLKRFLVNKLLYSVSDYAFTLGKSYEYLRDGLLIRDQINPSPLPLDAKLSVKYLLPEYSIVFLLQPLGTSRSVSERHLTSIYKSLADHLHAKYFQRLSIFVRYHPRSNIRYECFSDFQEIPQNIPFNSIHIPSTSLLIVSAFSSSAYFHPGSILTLAKTIDCFTDELYTNLCARFHNSISPEATLVEPKTITAAKQCVDSWALNINHSA